MPRRLVGNASADEGAGRERHATISITLDTYSHAIPALQKEAAALIAELVFAGPER